MSLPDVVLLGGGGHCRACIDVIEGTNRSIRGVLDPGLELGATVLGYPVLGGDEMIGALVDAGCEFLVGVGQIRDSSARVGLCEVVVRAGGRLATIVSKNAIVSEHASIGQGTIVMHGAQVGPCARIGRNCILNSACLVEHDSVVGDHCHVATRSVLNGGVKVGERSFVGSGGVCIQGAQLEPGTFVKAGALVT